MPGAAADLEITSKSQSRRTLPPLRFQHTLAKTAVSKYLAACSDAQYSAYHNYWVRGFHRIFQPPPAPGEAEKRRGNLLPNNSDTQSTCTTPSLPLLWENKPSMARSLFEVEEAFIRRWLLSSPLPSLSLGGQIAALLLLLLLVYGCSESFALARPHKRPNGK